MHYPFPRQSIDHFPLTIPIGSIPAAPTLCPHIYLLIGVLHRPGIHLNSRPLSSNLGLDKVLYWTFSTDSIHLCKCISMDSGSFALSPQTIFYVILGKQKLDWFEKTQVASSARSKLGCRYVFELKQMRKSCLFNHHILKPGRTQAAHPQRLSSQALPVMQEALLLSFGLNIYLNSHEQGI